MTSFSVAVKDIFGKSKRKACTIPTFVSCLKFIYSFKMFVGSLTQRFVSAKRLFRDV